MKYLLLFSLGISIPGFSQITINSTHTPVSGDTLRLSNAVIDQSLDYQTTGADINWDFSTLEYNGQKRNDYKPVSAAGQIAQFIFGSFAPTVYKASYFVANNTLPLASLPPQLPISITDISQFYRNDPDSLTLIGFKLTVNGQMVPAKSDTIETKYLFPVEYGNTHASRGYTRLDLNPAYAGIWIQHRDRQTEVDGYGSITTPYGTFDALRIHHRIEETDSFYVSISGFSTWIRIPVPVTHEYEWRATEEKEAILKITTSIVQGAEQITSVEYRNNLVISAGLDENSLEISMYPNPVSKTLMISTPEPFGSYGIFSADGKQVLAGQLSPSAQQAIDVTTLVNGTYFIRLQSDANTVFRTFIK